MFYSHLLGVYMLRPTDPNDATSQEVFLIYKAALVHGNLRVPQCNPPPGISGVCGIGEGCCAADMFGSLRSPGFRPLREL